MRNTNYLTLAIVAVAGLGLVGVTAAMPQDHAQHHTRQAAATQEEAASQTPAMCGPLMQQMMGEMHDHMAMMQRMMAEMHGQAGAQAMPGMGQGPTASMMQEMPGMGMMPDPATIDDPAVAEQQSERLQAMAERMRAHIEQLEPRIEALKQRAAELRQGGSP